MSDTNLDRRHFLKKTLLAAGAGVGGLAAAASAQDAKPDGKKDGPSTDKDADGAKLEAKVPRRELGGTGEKIPILLMGCAQKFNPRYDKMLHRAFKEGVDYLDTALVYAMGQSHKTLAPFIKQINNRYKLWITSKVHHGFNRATPASWERDLQTCLKQLEVDYLDMLFMHSLDNEKYVSKEYVKMAEKMKKAKTIRFFGFSCHDGNVVQLMNKAVKVGGIDAIMFRYNFSQYGDRALNRAIDACKKAKIGLIAMKTQKSVADKHEKVVKFKSKHFTLAQAKLKAVWADERIDAAVSHMDNLRKLKENVAAAKSPIKLGMHEFQQLNHLAACTAPYSCQGCSHICESHVAADTKVADALRFLMYHECYDEPDKARRLWRDLPAAHRQIEGVDFAKAASACPEGIDIPAQLERVRELLG